MSQALTKPEPFQIVAARPRIVGARVGRIVGVSDSGEVRVDFPGNPLGPAVAKCVSAIGRDKLDRLCASAAEVLLVFDDCDAARPVILDALGPAWSGTATVAEDERPPTSSVAERSSAAPAPAAIVSARIVGVDDGMALVECRGEGGGSRRAMTCVALRNLRDTVLVLVLGADEAYIIGQVHPELRLEGEGDSHADIALKGARVTIEAELGIELRSGVSRIFIDANGQITSHSDRIVSRARGTNKIQGGNIQLN